MAWDIGWPKPERDPTVDGLRAMAKHNVGDVVFYRIHKTLRVTPAMEAGLTDDVMSIADIVNLTNTPETK